MQASFSVKGSITCVSINLNVALITYWRNILAIRHILHITIFYFKSNTGTFEMRHCLFITGIWTILIIRGEQQLQFHVLLDWAIPFALLRVWSEGLEGGGLVCCFISLFYLAGASAVQQSFELDLSSINRSDDWGTNLIGEGLNSFWRLQAPPTPLLIIMLPTGLLILLRLPLLIIMLPTGLLILLPLLLLIIIMQQVDVLLMYWGYVTLHTRPQDSDDSYWINCLRNLL
jgi:hypothetical protein